MIQLGNCLCDSLLDLPDSHMTRQALKSACNGVLHVSRQGMLSSRPSYILFLDDALLQQVQDWFCDVAGCLVGDSESLADRLLQCALASSHPYIAIDVAACTLDSSPQACTHGHRCRPRVPLVTSVLSTLGRDACMGPTLLRRACKLQHWLLDLGNSDEMYTAMHAAACSMTIMEPMQV